MKLQIPLAALAVAGAISLGGMAAADNYQCVSDAGCTALMPGPGGTREVKFKKGDIVSTSSGWIVNPALGWRNVDAVNDALSCLPEGFEPTSIMLDASPEPSAG